MSKGYVYVLSNPSMPGLVKIGKTTREVTARATELWGTGVPTPFRVELEVATPDCDWLERQVHRMLSDRRVTIDREFFCCGWMEAASAVDAALLEQVSSFVDEFLPDYSLVTSFAFIDPAEIYELAGGVGADPADVAEAFRFITPDQIRPALAALEAWRARNPKPYSEGAE